MANTPDINKTRITVRMPLELRAKIRALAFEREQNESDLLLEAMVREFGHKKLSEQDKQWVESERNKNIAHRRHSSAV